MTRTLASKLLAAAALVAIAGCAKKPPEQLPPPAQETPTPADTGAVDNGSQAAGPGTQEHFRQNVSGDRIFFETDSSDIDDADRPILESQARYLAQYPNLRVTVEGHADERGTREYNLALGERRANAAKNYLVAQGVAATRITTISYGKERPDALGSDESAWAQNRRAVTLVIG